MRNIRPLDAVEKTVRDIADRIVGTQRCRGAPIRVAPIVLAAFLLLALTACSKPPEASSSGATDAVKSTGIESIPAADPSKYPRFSDMSNWKNPYLIVRDDGIGLVDLSNYEVHILKPEQVEAQLVSLPPSAWPYGRVVLVTEAKSKIMPSDQAKAELRKNRALLAGTLKGLDVVMREQP